METKTVEGIIGHHFQNPDLLEEALTHSTLVNEPPGAGRRANARMAHLGDAVLGLAVRSALFHRAPHGTKGDLTEEAKAFVSNVALAAMARQLGLHAFLGAGKGLAVDQDKVLAELLEAIFGAIYLDAGYERAAGVVETLILR